MRSVALALALILPAAGQAQDSLAVADSTTPATPPATTGPSVSFGGFVDAYYAWDVGKPDAFDRPFTTQPARHNEFNVNLAFLEARLSGEKVRGRLAIQAGTSVEANYAAEPSVGQYSGPDLVRLLQEAYVGVRVVPGLWVDGGIYASYIGLEGFISRDNPTYTRSLVADFTPYFLTGARLTWEASKTVTAQFHLVNGWANVSENNADKAVGARVDWMATSKLLLAASTFVGNEQPDSLASRARFYNQVMTRWSPGGGWTFWGQVDLGVQKVPTGESDTWWGFSAVAQARVAERVRVAGRIERLADPDQVVVTTGLPYGFETWGASLGVDVDVERRVLWRTEVRGFTSAEPVWPELGAPAASKRGGFLVTSVALTI